MKTVKRTMIEPAKMLALVVLLKGRLNCSELKFQQVPGFCLTFASRVLGDSLTRIP